MLTDQESVHKFRTRTENDTKQVKPMAIVKINCIPNQAKIKIIYQVERIQEIQFARY